MSDSTTFENVKGTAKEVVGELTGQEDLERAGEEQQKKAQKTEEAERLEDEAQQKRLEAAGHEGEQRKHE